jgi:hypothetical protein
MKSQQAITDRICDRLHELYLLPFAARAQQADQVRQIGVLMQLGEGEPQPCVEVAAFLQGLQELGWSEGHNPRIDTEYVFSNINNNGGDQGGQNEVLTPNASYRS